MVEDVAQQQREAAEVVRRQYLFVGKDVVFDAREAVEDELRVHLRAQQLVLALADAELEREVRCRALVNAAGPWIADVQKRIEPRPMTLDVELVAGTHIELSTTLERGIYYCEAPSDHRAVFLMPWKNHMLVGTTETPYRGDPARVAPLQSEIDYLLATLHRYMPKRECKLLAAWAGLRVLPKTTSNAFSRPRDVTLTVDDERAPHFVAIWGGKLTGYRATAEKVMHELRGSLPTRDRVADTATLTLPRAELRGS